MADRYPRVTISAGHGMSSRSPVVTDPGAVAYGHRESESVRILSRRLMQDLEVLGKWNMRAMFRDAGYFATADDDAARFGSDVFVELHFNAAASSSAKGVETLYNPNSDRGKRLARLVHSRLADALAPETPDRGVRQRTDLAVLRTHGAMASCLVEVAFITNRGDFANYLEDRDAVELAILNGILAYFGWKQVRSLPRKWSWLMRKRWRPY